MSVNIIRPLWSHLDELVRPQGSIDYIETVARRRSAVLLLGFGLSHVREYAPSALGGALVPCVHLALILRPCISSFVQSLNTFDQMCESIFTTSTPPAEGSDLEMGLSDPSAGVVRVFYIYLYIGLRHYVP